MIQRCANTGFRDLQVALLFWGLRAGLAGILEGSQPKTLLKTTGMATIGSSKGAQRGGPEILCDGPGFVYVSLAGRMTHYLIEYVSLATPPAPEQSIREMLQT